MATPQAPGSLPTVSSPASSLPHTQAPISPASSSPTPTRPTRPPPAPPVQTSNAALNSPYVRSSSTRSSTSSASSRHSVPSNPITTTSANAPNSPSLSHTPQISSPSVQTNPTVLAASPGAGTNRKRQTLPIILVEWRWELFTWALGTIAMSLILALLCIYEDRPITSWKSKVQISAIVAIFSQVAQSALIVSVSATIGQAKWSSLTGKRRTIDVERYDEAMRGPEGSMKMLVAAISNPQSPDNRRFRT